MVSRVVLGLLLAVTAASGARADGAAPGVPGKDEGQRQGGTHAGPAPVVAVAATKVAGTRAAAGAPRPGAAPAPAPQVAAAGRGLTASIRNELGQIQGLGRQAQRSREAYKIHCVGRREQAGRIVSRMADDALAAALTASETGDGTEATYQLARLRMLADKIRAVSGEAMRCLEDDGSYTSIYNHGVDISPAVPTEDVASGPGANRLSGP
jgi:hypothetical protein